jgi:F420-non-reducing hydrogenase iron-sulfur subunit
MKNLLEHMGVEPERLHFSWISSAESTKFVDVATKVTEAVKSLENKEKKFVKTKPKVA